MSRRRPAAGLYPHQNQQTQECAGVRTNRLYVTWRQDYIPRRHNAPTEQARKYLLLWTTLPVILPPPIYLHLLHCGTTLLGTTSWPPTSLQLCLLGEDGDGEE